MVYILFLFTLLPILYSINFILVYIIYIFMLSAIIFFYLNTNRKFFLEVPLLISCKFIIIAFLFVIYAYNTSSVMNLAAILFVEFLTMIIVSGLISQYNYIKFFRYLAAFCIADVVLYFILSLIFSKFLEIENPIEDFLSGERVRLLAWKTGHSILIDLSFICMLIALSNIAQLTIKQNIVIMAFSLISIIVAKSGGGYLLVAVTFFVFAVENSFLPPIIKSFIYLPLVLFIVAYFVEPDLLNDILLFIRVNLQNADTARYTNNDFTAGRADLNLLLIESITNHPWFGVGHEDPLIQYGVNIYSALRLDVGRNATTESGLRNAAKYGLIYFTVITLFMFQPLLAIFQTTTRSIRVFSVGLSFGLLTLSAVNSQFEVPHEPQHMIYLGLITLCIFMQKFDRTMPCSETMVSPGTRRLQLAYERFLKSQSLHDVK